MIRVQQLSHKYSQRWAIKDISFQIDLKGIVGLLGSNGAGKSTTLNIICGVLQQTQGEVFIENINLQKEPLLAKQKIGFLPQTAPLHFDMTVDEYLTYSAQLRQIDRKRIRAAVNGTKDRCGLMNYSRRLIRNLSGGYRQRVGIAQSIIHNPKLVVMDEPTNGLDPIQILEVRKLIKEIGEDRAVIFSSHILSEVEATCSNVLMIEGGRLVFSNTIKGFNSYIQPHSMLVSFRHTPGKEILLRLPHVEKVEAVSQDQLRIYFEQGYQVADQIIKESIANNWGLNELTPEKASLDEIFAQISKINIEAQA